MVAPEPSPDDLLAGGGGHATAAGVGFQASLGALLASLAIAARRLDRRLKLGAAGVARVRFETEAPLDDILVETTTGGYVFVQAKKSLSLSPKPDSEFGKTAAQIVRQWQACRMGAGIHGWDLPDNWSATGSSSPSDRFARARLLTISRRHSIS